MNYTFHYQSNHGFWGDDPDDPDISWYEELHSCTTENEAIQLAQEIINSDSEIDYMRVYEGGVQTDRWSVDVPQNAKLVFCFGNIDESED